MTPAAVRFGGTELGRSFSFELTGGALALDFVNTLDERRAAMPRELLPRYERLLQWSVQARVLSASRAARLRGPARDNSKAASKALFDAHELRDTLFAILATAEADKEIPRAALAEMNAWIRRAAQHRRLIQSHGQLSLSNLGTPDGLDMMLWPIVESGATLLSSIQLRERLRTCAGPTCAWMFLDFSRKNNRKWCDMSVCGNRAKARRHRNRLREGKS